MNIRSAKIVIFMIAISLILVSFIFSKITKDLQNLDENPVEVVETYSGQIVPTTSTWRFPNSDCSDQSENNGNIFFIKQGDVSDLYVMNGNGCFHNFVLEDVSGGPSWSVDRKLISIGCDHGKMICILDAVKTLETCTYPVIEEGKCKATILKKLPLYIINGDFFILKTSWSFNNKTIAVEVVSERNYYIILIPLDNSHEQKILMESFGKIHSEFSPIKNEIVFDGLFILSLEDTVLRNYTPGFSPTWSTDGSRIAYLTDTFGQNAQTVDIVEYSIVDQKATLLYEPQILDENYWPRRNVRIGDNSGNGQSLAWSPDNRYIAFVGAYQNDYDSQLFRLDKITGEVIILTNSDTQGYYYSPAWGP